MYNNFGVCLKMEKQKQLYFAYRFIMVAFLTLLLFSIFMPILSIDKYVEYTFNDPKFVNKYESSSTPIAERIRPMDAITALFSDEYDVKDLKREYEKVKSEYYRKYQNGDLSYDEYLQALANDKITAKYQYYTIYNGDLTYERIKDKIVLISIITLVFYIVTAIIWIIAIVNLFLNNHILYIINAQASWIIGVILLFYIIYVFSTSLTNTLDLEYLNDEYQVKQTTMYCFSVNWNFILLFVLLLGYIPFALVTCHKHNTKTTEVKEVPEFVSVQIRKEISGKKKRVPYALASNKNSNQNKNHKKKKKKKKKNGKK